jgi:hypothetical protein
MTTAIAFGLPTSTTPRELLRAALPFAAPAALLASLVRWRQLPLRRTHPPRPTWLGRQPVVTVGATALGALAVGAFSIGALAVGALAIGKLSLGKAEIEQVHIRSLTVDSLALPREAP